MSLYEFTCQYKSNDLEVAYEFNAGRDFQDGDFDLSIEKVISYSHGAPGGVEITDVLDSDDLDALSEMICESGELSDHAMDDMLAEADYRYDCWKDSQAEKMQ